MLTSVVWLILILLVSAGLLWGMVVVAYCRSLLSPPRLTDAKALIRLGRMSPADLGWEYQTLFFTPTAGVRLAAWWVETPEISKKVAILVHGYGDAKVGALAWGPVFRQLGFNLLLLDQRAHGESSGTSITAGVNEADDLDFVINEIRRSHPGRTSEVVLFGASLGGAAVALLATRRRDISAVVLDSPTATFESGVTAHARLLNLPGPFVTRPALRLAQYFSGVRFSTASVLANIEKVNAPTLLILPTLDSFISPQDRLSLTAALDRQRVVRPLSHLWEPPTHHLLAVAIDPSGYAEQLRAVSPNV